MKHLIDRILSCRPYSDPAIYYDVIQMTASSLREAIEFALPNASLDARARHFACVVCGQMSSDRISSLFREPAPRFVTDWQLMAILPCDRYWGNEKLHGLELIMTEKGHGLPAKSTCWPLNSNEPFMAQERGSDFRHFGELDISEDNFPELIDTSCPLWDLHQRGCISAAAIPVLLQIARSQVFVELRSQAELCDALRREMSSAPEHIVCFDVPRQQMGQEVFMSPPAPPPTSLGPPFDPAKAVRKLAELHKAGYRF